MSKLKNFINFINDLRSLNANSVVIYQMGKVGSSSIEESLRKRGVHVMHLHKISPVDVYFYDLGMIDRFKKIRASILFYIGNIVFKRRACKVITIVRDPLSRTLSQMFHHIDLLIYNRNKTDSRREISANELFQEIFTKDINLNYAREWMEQEFRESIGDFNELSFNKNKGYGIKAFDNKKVLFLRFEDINNLSLVIGDFCDLKNFELVSANRSGNKWYGDLYKSFKENIIVDETIINAMYENKFHAKFYNEAALGKSSKSPGL